MPAALPPDPPARSAPSGPAGPTLLQPRVGVGVLLLRGTQVLLGRRLGSHGAGTWALPGGHLEFGETPEQCARRELREETGLDLSQFQRGPYTNDPMPDEGLHYVTLFLLAAAPAAAPRRMEPHKCAGWQWCDWQALPQPLFGPLQRLQTSGYRPHLSAR